MTIRKVGDAAYFVIDTFSYRAPIQEYDPLATNQTLLFFDDDVEGGLAVLEEPAGDRDDFLDEMYVDGEGDEETQAISELERITPSNAELLKLARRFPVPREWYNE